VARRALIHMLDRYSESSHRTMSIAPGDQRVVRVESFGSHRFAFVVIHAGLDAGWRCQVPQVSTRRQPAPLTNLDSIIPAASLRYMLMLDD
jgi:hypothetical protein